MSETMSPSDRLAWFESIQPPADHWTEYEEASGYAASVRAWQAETRAWLRAQIVAASQPG